MPRCHMNALPRVQGRVHGAAVLGAWRRFGIVGMSVFTEFVVVSTFEDGGGVGEKDPGIHGAAWELIPLARLLSIRYVE